jgi:hypothetical protein
MTFKSFEKGITHVLGMIMEDKVTHGKWLNTLSYLEYCGARKITHRPQREALSTERLRHSAEEARHAYYLRSQISKLVPSPPLNYQSRHLYGGHLTIRYLDLLDLGVCRYLKREVGSTQGDLTDLAYLLVTYAIERRAEEFYPIYQGFLEQKESPVSVRGIILEEEHYLVEMEKSLKRWPDSEKHRDKACQIESQLFEEWIAGVGQEVAEELASTCAV